MSKKLPKPADAAQGEHSYGDGLYLVVTGGSRRWMTYYREPVPGQAKPKRRRYWIGRTDLTDIDIARSMVIRVRQTVKAGKDPAVERKRRADTDAAPTFIEYAHKQMDLWLPHLKNPKNREKWRSSVENHTKAVAQMRITQIRRPHIIDCMTPIWRTTPIIAQEVLGRLARIFDAAIADELYPGPNPASWDKTLEAKLGKPIERGKVRGSHKAIEYTDIPAFMAELRGYKAATARMLEVTILTCLRTSEIRLMRRSQLHLDEAKWIIPNAQMKFDHGLDHDVPLVPRALEILREQVVVLDDVFGNGVDYYVWPGRRTSARVSDNTMLSFLKKTMGRNATVHGFRSTFRTWADDHLLPQGVDDDVIEMCLAHRSGSGGKRTSKVKRAYRRGTLYAARGPVMDQWAALCESAAGNIVALPRKMVA